MSRLVKIPDSQLSRWQEQIDAYLAACPSPEAPAADWLALFSTLQAAYVYQIPLKTKFRRINIREGMIFQSANQLSEFAPFWDYGPDLTAKWLEAGLRDASLGDLKMQRGRVPVNVTIPVVSPDQAYELVKNSGGCLSAKVKVADPGVPLSQDAARIAAVRAGLIENQQAQPGSAAIRIRIDVNGAWDSSQAIQAIPILDRAAEGLEYVEQPCATIPELITVNQKTRPALAADESIRLSPNPLEDLPPEAAEIMIVKIQPLGGICRTLALAKQAQDRAMSVTVSSAIDSGVGIWQGIRAAAALPDLRYACGLATSQLLQGDVVACPWQVKAGSLPVQAVHLDQSLLEDDAQGSLADTDLSRRWINRLDEVLQYLGVRSGLE